MPSADPSPNPMRLWIDGSAAEVDALATLAMVNYGHFTAMQVRGLRVRGVTAHLSRVDAAHRELFGHGLDRERVRREWSAAVADRPDASLRATFYDDTAGETHIAIVVRAPVDAPSAPQSLRSVAYLRPIAHLKHVGTFGQIYHGEQAERAGYDDALLVDDQRRIAETTMANIGFIRQRTIIWPNAPMLDGIGQQLLNEAAARDGIPTDRAPVSLDELHDFEGAFTVNSVGVVPVRRIDAHQFNAAAESVGQVIDLHRRLPWDDLGH